MAQMPIHFGVTIGQHAYDWPSLLDAFRLAEALDFDHGWLYDHFVGPELPAEPGSTEAAYAPAMEAWTLLAGVAARTARLRIGVMVTCNTYRHPALLAKEAATVDQISGGRLILGLGACSHAAEHAMYGFRFPAPRERVDMVGEAVAVIDCLMRQDRTTFDGQYYQLHHAPFAPKPVQQPRVPIVIGSSGRRMLRIVARYADMWDVSGTPEEVAMKVQELETACREVGRDPGEIRRITGCDTALLASPARFRDWVERYRELGFTDFRLEFPEAAQVELLHTIARKVIPMLRAV